MVVADFSVAPDEARAELCRILESEDFNASERNRRFLGYVIEETLAGRADRIKAYCIATSVFGRDDDFDAQLDPIVRIEAGRLRRSLERYYLTAGSDDRIRISIPKGGYVPAFELAGSADASPAASGPEETGDEWVPTLPRRSWRSIRFTQGGALIAGLAIALLAVAWLGRFPLFDEPLSEPLASRNGPAVFVAPFEQEGDLSAFPDLSRGFTREVIVGLTRFGDLFVFGPETSSRYGAKGGSDRAVADLGVDFVLTGGLMVSGDRLTMDALLVDVKSGRYLWAHSFDKPLGAAGIIETRNEIADRVARTLAQPYGVIFANKVKESDGKPPGSLSSYECVIRFYQYWRTFDRNSYASVRACLEKAVVADPHYAEAFAALSLTYSDGYRFGFDRSTTADELLAKALADARRAIELAPNGTRGYHALSLAYWLTNDVERSFEAARAGLAVNPNDTELMAAHGMRLCWQNQWDRGLSLQREAYARNPASSSGYRLTMSIGHYLNGRYREALAEAELIETPYLIYAYAAAAMAAAQLGLEQKAAAAIERVLAIDPKFGDHFVEHLQSRNIHPDLIPILADGLRQAGLDVPEEVAGGKS